MPSATREAVEAWFQDAIGFATLLRGHRPAHGGMARKRAHDLRTAWHGREQVCGPGRLESEPGNRRRSAMYERQDWTLSIHYSTLSRPGLRPAPRSCHQRAHCELSTADGRIYRFSWSVS